MSKKHFIALADCVRFERGPRGQLSDLTDVQFRAVLGLLCAFLRSQNARFKQQRWLDYVNGECGPNGGKVKRSGVQS